MWNYRVVYFHVKRLSRGTTGKKGPEELPMLAPTPSPAQPEPRPAASWRRPALGAALVGLTLLGGMGAARALEERREYERNQELRTALTTVRMALEQYGTDHNGDYPPAGQVVAALTKPGTHYLPSDRLPPNPWSPTGEPIALVGGPFPAPMPAITRIARGEVNLALTETDLGLGPAPGGPTANALSLGSLFYDYDPDRHMYVLCAVGQRRGHARVIGDASNTSS